MAFGVTDEGFAQKELDDVEGEVKDDLRSSFGQQTNLLATSVFGQITGIFSDKIAELWEVLTAVYRSAYPDSATGDALDNAAAYTGAERLVARKSTITLDQISLDGGITLPVGRIVSVGAAGNRFVTTAAVTNAAGFQATVSVEAESEQTGPVTGFSGTVDTIVTPVSGWSAQAALTCASAETYNLSGGETLTVKVDEGTTQTVNFIGGDFGTPGAATAAEVAARITTDLTGAAAFAAGTRVRIESDLNGSGSAIQVTGGTANSELGFDTTLVKGFNSEDAIIGSDVETDFAFRLRREQLIRATGAATVEAILSKVLQVTNVDEVFVFENPTETTDPSGVPPHAFEVVIRGPSAIDAEVAQAIFDAKPAGIQAYGSTVEVIVDSQGFNHSIGFSRATEVDIYIDIDLTVNTDPAAGPIYPVDGDAQVEIALAAAGNALGIGRDVISEAIKCKAFDVDGVIDITDFDIGIAPAPVGDANITIQNREIAVFDTGDIVVNS